MSTCPRILIAWLGLAIGSSPIDAASTQPASHPAAEADNAGLIRDFDALFDRVCRDIPPTSDNLKGLVAWGSAYMLEALAEVVQSTHDPVYAEKFIRLASDVSAVRDDRHQRRDVFRDKILPAWGCIAYTEGKHYVWAVHTGMICAPMAQFAAVVKRDDALRARFGADADRILKIAAESMAVHDDQYREGPGTDEGYVYGETVTRHLPLNQMLAPGRAWLWLYQATGEVRYRRRVERLLRFALNRVRRPPDGTMIWCYWPPLEGPGEGLEDTSHASITADFLVQCVEHGLAPREVLTALEQTFLNRVLLGPETVANYLEGQGINAHRYAPCLWGRLARHHPIIRRKMIEHARLYAPVSTSNACLLVGYAHLLAATPGHWIADWSNGLIGEWLLGSDCQDTSGGGNHGVNRRVNLQGADPEGGSRTAAAFNGRDAWIEVKTSPSLKLNRRDFTVSAWVHTQSQIDDVLGDIVCMYDPATRSGFHLGLMNYAGVTSSQSNYRNVTFGIDRASPDAGFTDCGRPGNSLFVLALTVHDGGLYAGTFETGLNEAGHVWRYSGGTQWTDCGSPDRSNAVLCLTSFDGALYAGTGRYLARGSALPDSPNVTPGGHVYRYEAPGKWIDCGRLENPTTGAAVNLHSLAEYRGRLYASTLNAEGMGLYEYLGGSNWKYCGNPGGRRVETLTVHNGYLYATSYDGGIVSRYNADGKWEELPPIPDVTQTYGFIVYDGGLHVTTWPTGSVFRLGPDDHWINRGRLGDQTEVMGVSVYNGKLYAGTLPLAQVYRYDGDMKWTNLGQLDRTPDVTYRRVWSMAVYQGRLFCGTLPSGHVYSMEAGKCATYDHALKPGWRLLAGVRRGDRLELYVDGELAAVSSAFDPASFDITTARPLTIGFGPHDYFFGRIRDVRLYGRALSPAALAAAWRAGRTPAPMR